MCEQAWACANERQQRAHRGKGDDRRQCGGNNNNSSSSSRSSRSSSRSSSGSGNGNGGSSSDSSCSSQPCTQADVERRRSGGDWSKRVPRPAGNRCCANEMKKEREMPNRGNSDGGVSGSEKEHAYEGRRTTAETDGCDTGVLVVMRIAPVKQGASMLVSGPLRLDQKTDEIVALAPSMHLTMCEMILIAKPAALVSRAAAAAAAVTTAVVGVACVCMRSPWHCTRNVVLLADDWSGRICTSGSCVSCAAQASLHSCRYMSMVGDK
ncbi:hypothetical protein THASP1DRAFT_24380 [Thamnocephalis sphaerospora]|uniref:Uncharacterized protein n=1 Tax=Thamnocephalis sphaerospora TaxID=78915 RepID=A0A4P9XNE6_9FUNG|nr:hypothetical protein THASP1DRAFT_24380 [Thamnocephalis sphaerospora]|eukprot:RKP07474.1 hypothetical protein THASP1DRAFT_24380 [Thamnocephalis sphaerospora]